MPETPYFSCEDLSLDLGGREVLRNISLELREGEVLGIIGPNGAGKTSLLEILSGRYRPKSGKVYFGGQDINELSLFERARLGIGRTYQTPIVPEELTVGETMKAARQAFRPLLTRFDAEYSAPAAGLINAEIDEIDQILRMLSKEMNVAVLIVEHRIELLVSIADRVIVMDAGEIIARGELAEIIDSPAVRAAYFETQRAG